MNYLMKTQYQHGYSHAYVVPKEAIATPSSNLMYCALLATHTSIPHHKPLHQNLPYNL